MSNLIDSSEKKRKKIINKMILCERVSACVRTKKRKGIKIGLLINKQLKVKERKTIFPTD